MATPNNSFLRPYLTTRSLQPENQETPIKFMNTPHITDRLFFRRNHFSYPTLPFSHYWLPVHGLVQNPTLFTLQDLLRFPSKILKVVLECAGNQRSKFEPKVFGEQWEKGAISQGEWKGVPLKTLLEHVGIKDGAKEVVFEAYDYGSRTDTDKIHTFTRSLPLEKALHPDTLIAYEYNQKPIPFKHGYPLRLIVPQWYAMASVKWIKQIKVIDSKFTGPFQTTDYVYYPAQEGDKNAFPVTDIHVNSIIQKPLDMDTLNTGRHSIHGIAWTGKGQISKVEVSTDNGSTWTLAKLEHPANAPYGWVPWSYQWTVTEKGEYTIMSKATDSENRTQPEAAFWNRKGYGYNAVDKIKVRVE